MLDRMRVTSFMGETPGTAPRPDRRKPGASSAPLSLTWEEGRRRAAVGPKTRTPSTDPNVLPVKGVESSRGRQKSVEGRAGDRTRTGDVQLGKRSTVPTRRLTEVCESLAYQHFMQMTLQVQRRLPFVATLH